MPELVAQVAVSVAAAVAVALTVRRLPDLWLRPRASAATVPGLSGEQLARAWPVVAVLGSLALVSIAAGVWLAELDPPPHWVGEMVGIATVVLFVVGGAVGGLGFPRSLVPPSLRTREALHEAVVYALPDAFIAMCSCDWVDEAVPTEDAARRAAAGHTRNVKPEVEQPLM